jgi:tetratricopeptide (TPR) repeat protein
MDSFQNASDYAKDGSETKRMAIVNIGNLYQK